MKIRTKLITAFALPFLIIYGISAIMIYLQTTDIMQGQEMRSLDNVFSHMDRELSFYDDSVNSSRQTAVSMYMKGFADSLYDRVDDLYAEYKAGKITRSKMDKEIKSLILGATIVDTGYAYTLNSKGVLVIHKTSSGRDLSGEDHIKEIIRRKNGEKQYTAATTGQEKFVSYRYFKPLDAIIVPGVNMKELEVLYDKIREEGLLNTLGVNLKKAQNNLNVFGAVHVIDSDGSVFYSSSLNPPDDLKEIISGQPSGEEKSTYIFARNYRDTEEEFSFFSMPSVTGRHLVIELSQKDMLANRSKFTSSLIIIFIVVEILIILLLVFIAGKFVAPIAGITERFSVLASGSGDLSVKIKVKGKDEISDLARSFNTFTGKLKGIIISLKDQITSNSLIMGQFDSNIEEAASQLEVMNFTISEIDKDIRQITAQIEESFIAASEINKSADSIQQKAFSQNSAVEQSSASVEELLAAINNLASVADARMEVIKTLNDSARIGQERMNNTEHSISLIADSAGVIQELITVIEGIAQSTNLLAMNAAIEAAHAGEAGKGFSVVADEIRKLAENTQENSRNITENISSILETIMTTQEITKLTGQSIAEIAVDVSDVYEGIKEIHNGLSEMSVGTSEITSSVSLLSETSSSLSDSTVDIHEKTGIIEKTLSSVNQMASSTEKNVEDFLKSTKLVLDATTKISDMGQKAVENAEEMNKSVKQFKT